MVRTQTFVVDFDGKTVSFKKKYSWMVLKMKKSFPLFVNSVCRPATLNFFIRAFCLFIFGLLISCVLNVMLILPELRRKVVFERELVERLYSTLWWFAPSCGLASSIVGMMYPCTDMRFGQPHHLRNEWSSVVRCEVLFFGIIHAAVVSFLCIDKFWVVICFCVVSS